MRYLSMSTYVTKNYEKYIAGTQHFKCANQPGTNISGLKKFDCPLWKIDGLNKGLFNTTGYELDPVTKTYALCRACHLHKNIQFLLNKNTNPCIKFHSVTKKPEKTIKYVKTHMCPENKYSVFNFVHYDVSDESDKSDESNGSYELNNSSNTMNVIDLTNSDSDFGSNSDSNSNSDSDSDSNSESDISMHTDK